MKFSLVLSGIVLLAIGLVVYSAILTVHDVPIQTTQTLFRDREISLSSFSSAQTPENVSIVQGKNNDLVIKITVSLWTGTLSSTQLKVFTVDKFQSCMASPQPSGCLVSRTVSNSTLTIPVTASSTYYFGFDNTSSNSSKTISFSASLSVSSTDKVVARDSGWSIAGLGVATVGLFVALLGAASKTVIPWE